MCAQCKSNAPDDLHAALRDVFDLFESLGGIKCLLLGKTAQSAKKGKLEGDKITVGIRELELTGKGSTNRKGQIYSWIANYFRRGYSKTMLFEPELEHIISYDFHGIPIEIKVIQRKYNFLKNPEPIIYNYDDYIIPNPLDKYLKTQYIVQ